MTKHPWMLCAASFTASTFDFFFFFLSRHVGSRWRWRMNLREEDQRDVMLIYGHPRIHGSYQSLITILNFAFLENHQLLGIWSSSELDHSTKSKPKVLPVPWHIAHLFSILWGDSMTASKNSDRSYHHHQVLYTSAQNFFNFFFYQTLNQTHKTRF